MGDGRTYANVVAVRAVTSEDGMTADWAKLPYDVLARISARIVNEVRGRQPRRLRHQQQAARDDRVGVTMSRSSASPPIAGTVLRARGAPFGCSGSGRTAPGWPARPAGHGQALDHG